MYIYIHAQVIQNCTTLSRVDIYNKDGKTKKTKTWEAQCSDVCNKTNADGVSLHQFPQTPDAGQYIWLLPATVHCNILQIFIFDHIHFLVKDVFFHPQATLIGSFHTDTLS